ncbi:MAG: methionyl-tRNA formyltransferase, partial [Mollicutes bacterium PWAP]|nr:methionyl-tRNA formyltransferase [Mollicutes bacterium PWAP]
MKIILAGSPQISVKAFEEVIKNFKVVAIITQPDKRKGRGMKLQETPVSKLASKHGIKVFKPEKISYIYSSLKKLKYDLFLTFAFGQWIPSKILNITKLPALNIHGSLLPKYRGAAPIHHAILNGEKEIGITLIKMIKEMDAGKMYFYDSKEINEFTTVGKGFEIISNLAAKNIVNWLNNFKNNSFSGKEQGDFFTLSPKIEKSFAIIDSTMDAETIKRKIVGLNPFPGAFTYIDGIRYKLFMYSNEPHKNYLNIKTSDG